MDLVLINSPIQKYSKEYRPKYRTTAPLGLGYLGSVAQNAGIETAIVDAEAEKLTVAELTERVNNMNPQTVGINTTSTNYKISLEILDKLEAPRKIVGGPHATLRGKEDFTGDYLVVRGEAENVFLDAIRGMYQGVIDAGTVTDLDRLPFINRALFSNDPYIIGEKVEASVSTSRGCPFSCVFCAVPIMNGRKIRARSIGNVISEIKSLQASGVNSIHFMDDIINHNRKRLESMCSAFIDQGINVSWRGLARVELLDDKLLEKMAHAGCYKLAFGIESGTPRILDYIGKCSDLDYIKSIFQKCRELGIDTKAFFTIGYPSETEDEIRRTIGFSLELNANEAYFMVVRAFPGTPLYAEMRTAGFSEEELGRYKQFQDEDGYVKYHVMNFRSLNGMSNEHLDDLVKEAYGRFYKKEDCCV
jgi:anaerobic magnesium-protoporphyrin IX monomethyl ester cyclase